MWVAQTSPSEFWAFGSTGWSMKINMVLPLLHSKRTITEDDQLIGIIEQAVAQYGGGLRQLYGGFGNDEDPHARKSRS
jgi:hypothetical protein